MTDPNDIPALIAVLKRTAPGGFAVGLHLRYTTPTYMFQTYPDAWLAEYSRDGLLLRDPVVAWSFANRGVTTWAELEPEDEGGVLARARAHGLNHGLAVSFEDGGSLSMGGFARGDRPFAPEEAEAIEATLRELHARTAGVGSLPPEVREGLRRLSVAFTHP